MFSKSKNTTVTNNRNQKRVIRDDIIVAFQAKVGKKTFSFYVDLLNISTQGMAFRCKKSLRVSTPLNLAFSFSDGRNFFMKGSVAHKMQETEGGELGIQRAFKKMFKSDSTFFQYGIKFEKVDDDFQTTFIETKLQNMGNVKKQHQVSTFTALASKIWSVKKGAIRGAFCRRGQREYWTSALQAYAKQVNDADMEIWLAEIKVRARRRVGQISNELETISPKDSGKMTHSGSLAVELPKKQILENAGLTKSVANRCEKIAEIPAGKFDSEILETDFKNYL